MLLEVGERDRLPIPRATFRRNLDRLSLAGCSPAEPASVSPDTVIFLVQRFHVKKIYRQLFASTFSFSAFCAFLWLRTIYDPFRRKYGGPVRPVCFSEQYGQWRYIAEYGCNDGQTGRRAEWLSGRRRPA